MKAALAELIDRLQLPCPPVPLQPGRQRADWTFVLEAQLGGYKARKYLSLIPWLQAQGCPRVVLQGSRRGNNLAELAARLIAAGLQPALPLSSRPRRGDRLGNELLLELLQLPEGSDDGQLVVPEGASCLASLPGALTLAASLGQSMLDHSRQPARIYVDAGTGFTAAALLLGLGQLNFEGDVHIVDMAGTGHQGVENWLTQMRSSLTWLGAVPRWYLSRPPTARSFGSTNRRVWDEVGRMASQEGLWIDPLYSAKLLLTARENSGSEPSWLILSGGKTELMAWQPILRIDSYTGKL